MHLVITNIVSRAVDFNSTNGDCRTQAAAVIDQHPAFFAFEDAGVNRIVMRC